MTEDLKSTRPEGEQAHPADFADASAPSDRLVIPRPLRIIGYAVTLAVTAYPVYLGIATLQDKRAESLREAAVHKQQLEQETIRQKEQWQRDDATRREADYKKAQQDAEGAVARKEEARLRLQLSRQESQDKIELSKVEIRERERKAASDQAERFGKEFQEQLGRVLDASPRHVASEIAGLNRFFKGTADQRNAIMMTLEARLQNATTPEEVYPVFSAFEYLGQDAFQVVLRNNQDALASLHPTLEADYLGHRHNPNLDGIGHDTVTDIDHAFAGSPAAIDLKAWLDYLVRRESLDDDKIIKQSVEASASAHQRLIVQFAILKASRDAIAGLLTFMHVPSITLDRCFLPDVALSANHELNEVEFRDTYMTGADLRKLPPHALIHVRRLRVNLVDSPNGSSLDSLEKAHFEYLTSQVITFDQ